MALRFRCWPPSHAAVVLIAAFALVVACAPRDEPPASTDESPGPADLTNFATRYAAAWSSQDPGVIALSNGHYDQAEFERQMAAELP